jgi:glycosyltransferase involved in cell wall biosynthesis
VGALAAARTLMRVGFFGAYDPDYPRNRILREGLRLAGHEVIEIRVRERRAFRRWPALIARHSQVGRGAEVLLVPEFRHKDVPLARGLAAGRPVVFDPLVSRHDTLVEDWGLHRAGSPQARWNAWIDRWSLASSDLVLCDTWAHGQLFESLGVPRARLRRVPVGAESVFFEIPAGRPSSAVRVVYLGGFLPLHGILHVVEALTRLERDPTLPEFRVVLAGRGIEWEAAKRWAAEHGLARVSFPGLIVYRDAPQLYADADIVLGAFGAGEKAGRVVPHKVWQGLAAGRAVLTGEGDGLSEWFESNVHLATCARGNPLALAEALAALIRDAAARARLAAAGQALAREVATPKRVGETLASALAEARA